MIAEEYFKAHPDLRLVVIDTWGKVAPPSGERRCSQYEGDYEALTPLKRLADTYHVSILAVHHLRKTGSSDVLDEIIGSTGVTGAVDGTMILKRDRGQNDATLFVTGRDVEREQHLTLSFDVTTAMWTLVGNAEDLRCTRARQEILDLLREQGPDGMNPREIAEALQKNYHTTRSLLRKMEETGEVRRSDGHYIATGTDAVHNHWRPSDAIDQLQQRNQFQQQTATMGVRDACSGEEDSTVREEQQEAFHHRERCPHHPRAHLVRFDPAGQAWCDKLECWDCYRLMKIGEELEYRCLTDLGEKVVIDQGMAAWSAFVHAPRSFLVVVATEQAIALCKAIGIEVPDVSDEVKRLVEVRPMIT